MSRHLHAPHSDDGAPRRVHLAAALIVASALVVLVPGVHAASAASCWTPPVDGRVVDPFREPPCPYCAGNRGLEYRVGAKTPVVSVAAGTVTFAGAIAGVRYVVVRHANGWRTTYGKLSSTSLTVGDRVLSGTTVGSASRDFYFGLRRGETYIDPAPHLGRLVGRPRLVPIDRTAPRPAPPPRLRCAA